MKKITAIILGIALFLMLTSCTQNATTPEETTTTTTTTQEVDLNEETSEVEIKDWEWTDYNDEELVSPEGIKFKFPSLNGRYGYRYIIKGNDDRCLIMSGPNSIWLANAEDGTLVCLSEDQVVVDYTVAYDTIYWFNMDREVWSSAWQSDDCTAELFCKDAIAVSPFTDEAEGAVVDPERANWDGYGGIPIYSPYGE